jgi:GT2 family glycosyltransferase
MTKNTPAPLVSIVVLNWNGLANTKVCLEHLRKLDYRNYEIIVVDNGSADGSKEFFETLTDIVYIDNPTNRGFTGGHIDGLAKAKGEFILLLNNDAVVKHDYLTVALESFQDKQVAAVGGRAYFWNDDAPLLDEQNPFYSYMEVDIFSGEARMLSQDSSRIQEVNVVSGSAVLVRRSVIDKIGYLYDPFFAYFEETDLFARMKRAGYKVLYDPRLRIWHRNGASSGASSGSYFFFYHIFRNRFIFAVRNFEPWFLRRFLLHYAKVGLVSALQVVRDPANRTMHKAYAKAALYNLAHLPQTLGLRRALRRELGASRYNHQLYREQTGISIVIDCSGVTQREHSSLVAHIEADNNPLHEYVLVTNNEATAPKLPKNARYVVDRGYFDTPPLNLGCIAARFGWMVLCTAQNMPDTTAVAQATTNTLGTQTDVIGFKAAARRAPYIVMHKAFFERTGGLQTSGLQQCFTRALQYAQLTRSVLWTPVDEKQASIAMEPLHHEALKELHRDIRFDKHLKRGNTIGWLGRLQNKYYRVFQVVTFVRWLGALSIPPRLKLARLRNLALFTLRLRVRSLATEFKHIRNEVLLHSGQHAIVAEQTKIIKEQLALCRQDPTAIPVFIVCFERIDALKQLVRWLERHNMKHIVFIDNDSSYPRLLNYYEQTPYQVLRLYRNTGHTAPWSLGIARVLVPHGFYIVTDPDVIPTEECPSDFMEHFLGLHEQFAAYQKVGFGLRIDDLPDNYPLKRPVIEWESQFWKQTLAPEIYEAGVDTTFAVYKPFTYSYMLHPSIRTGKPYVARHLPWYHNPNDTTEEDIYYKFRADRSVNSWNTGELPERYAKEMKKQKATS